MASGVYDVPKTLKPPTMLRMGAEAVRSFIGTFEGGRGVDGSGWKRLRGPAGANAAQTALENAMADVLGWVETINVDELPPERLQLVGELDTDFCEEQRGKQFVDGVAVETEYLTRTLPWYANMLEEWADELDGGQGRARSGARRKRRVTGKPTDQSLTPRQTEAVGLFYEHKGNIAAAARAMGVHRKTFDQHRRAGFRKLGKKKPPKTKTQRLPTDRRGQPTV